MSAQKLLPGKISNLDIKSALSFLSSLIPSYLNKVSVTILEQEDITLKKLVFTSQALQNFV